MTYGLFETPLFYVGQHYVSIFGLLGAFGLFAIGLILARFLQSSIIRRLLSRFKLDTNFLAIVTMILSVVSVAFFTVSAINGAGIPLAWSAPLPGIKLSLLQIFLLITMLVAVFWISSLQGIASSFISGLVILAERPISIGDRVEVGDITGQVERIHARSTIIRTNDNISMIVPNSKFIEDPVTNWTYGDPRVRFRIPVGVAYGSDVEKVRQALIEVGLAHPNALKDPAPSVFFDKFGESSLDFELVVWSSEMSYRPRRFKSDLNFAIERKFRELGIEIPFPQREVYIKNAKMDGTSRAPSYEAANRDGQG